jgi:hypothetical protein
MTILHIYQDVCFKKLANTDEEQLIKLLCQTRNPVDKVIDAGTYDNWNKCSLQVALQENLSIVLKEKATDKLIGYMIFRDYVSPLSENEILIMHDPTIQKYNRVLDTLSQRFNSDYPEVKEGEVLKLVDSGVSPEFLKRGIAIAALKWAVQYSRQIGYKCLTVETLSSKGIQLATMMGNSVYQEEDASLFEGFHHLGTYPIQFTIQWLTPISKL